MPSLPVAAVAFAVMTLGACASGDSGDRPELTQSTSTSSTATTPTTVPTASVKARTDKTVTVAPPGAVEVELICCAFSPAEVTVRGTTPTLFLVNRQTDNDVAGVVRRSDLQHDFAVAGPGGITLAQSERLAIGERAALTFEGLGPGTYDFYCTLVGHSLQGMRGKLRVEA